MMPNKLRVRLKDSHTADCGMTSSRVATDAADKYSSANSCLQMGCIYNMDIVYSTTGTALICA